MRRVTDRGPNTAAYGPHPLDGRIGYVKAGPDAAGCYTVRFGTETHTAIRREAVVEFDAETHTYTRNGVKLPSVTQVLKAVLPSPYAIGEWYLTRGTATHYACELIDQGKLDWASVDEEILPRVKAYCRYCTMTRPPFFAYCSSRSLCRVRDESVS